MMEERRRVEDERRGPVFEYRRPAEDPERPADARQALDDHVLLAEEAADGDRGGPPPGLQHRHLAAPRVAPLRPHGVAQPDEREYLAAEEEHLAPADRPDARGDEVRGLAHVRQREGV